MKKDIHPEYFDTTVTCNCGETFVTGSTVPEIRVEICSKCHPVYTGSAQFRSQGGGRVERFRKRYQLNEDNDENTKEQ